MNANARPIQNADHAAQFIMGGKCGRKLTHPESLETGLGPICDGRD